MKPSTQGKAGTPVTRRLRGLPLHQAAANRFGLPKVDIDFSRLGKAETGKWLSFSFDDASPSSRKGALARIRQDIAAKDVSQLNAAVRIPEGAEARIHFDNGDYVVCYFASKTAKSAIACYRITRDQLESGAW